jgi:hypothetical protein
MHLLASIDTKTFRVPAAQNVDEEFASTQTPQVGSPPSRYLN